MPDAAIGADVMVGFPGRNRRRFRRQPRSFIESLPFTYLHVFTYSERPGTPAAEDPQAGPDGRCAKSATGILRELAAPRTALFARAWWAARFPPSRCMNQV